MSRHLLFLGLFGVLGACGGSSEPLPVGSIQFHMVNNTGQPIYIQATEACSSKAGWYGVFDPEGAPVIEQLVCPNECGRDGEFCAAACIAPSVAEVAPGQTVSNFWDGIHWQSQRRGDGSSCMERVGADAGPFEVEFCWSLEQPAQEFAAELETKQCQRRTFTLGVDQEVRIELPAL